MPTVIGNLLRRSLRRRGDRLSILLFRHREAFDTALCETGHAYYGYHLPESPWDSRFALPDNLLLCPPSLPTELDFDVGLGPRLGPVAQTARDLCPRFHIPYIACWHEGPNPGWSPARKRHARRADRGDWNVLPSRRHYELWGPFDRDEEERLVVLAPQDTAGWCVFLEKVCQTPYLPGG